MIKRKKVRKIKMMTKRTRRIKRQLKAKRKMSKSRMNQKDLTVASLSA